MNLDAKVPGGPVGSKWERHRFDMKLVNPANKRRFDAIVVPDCGANAWNISSWSNRMKMKKRKKIPSRPKLRKNMCGHPKMWPTPSKVSFAGLLI